MRTKKPKPQLSLPRRLEKMRREAGLTCNQFADLLFPRFQTSGGQRGTYHAIRTRRKRFPKRARPQLAALLGVPLEEVTRAAESYKLTPYVRDGHNKRRK